MKRILGGLLLFVACAIPSRAQNIVMQQRCYSQACAFSSWQPNKAGDLLVAVTRALKNVTLPCESTPQGCGQGLLLVSDLVGNHWQKAYKNSLASEVWYADDAKPGLNIVGVMASVGYWYPPLDIQGGGTFDFDVVIFEFPPSAGLDAAAHRNYVDNQPPGGTGDDNPNAGPITVTTSNTLLLAWTDNFAYNNSKGPLTLTANTPGFNVVTDDGFLAIALSTVQAPGSYSFSGNYNGNALWSAGIIAFKMCPSEDQDSHRSKSCTAPHDRDDNVFGKRVPNENAPAPNSQTTTLSIEETPTSPRRR
jgi:hypothetical protein